MYTGNPHSRRAEGITPPWQSHEARHGLNSIPQPAAAPRPNMDTMRGWFKGGPVDSPRPFTQGFQQSIYGPLAELSQKQMNYMQNPYMNPALGGISEEELWNNVKDMDYVRPWYKPWGKESQEPSTRSEFNDFQTHLKRSGQWAT